MGVVAICITVLAAAVGLISSHYMGDDNIVEESMEEVIHLETGLSVDLTPSSPEKS